MPLHHRDPCQWLNGSCGLVLIFDDEITAGLWQRLVMPLELINAGTPQLSQSVTLIHRLTADSPVCELDLKELPRRHAVMLPPVEGIDENTCNGLLQTHLHRMAELQLNRRFRALISVEAAGVRPVHLERLDERVPC